MVEERDDSDAKIVGIEKGGMPVNIWRKGVDMLL